MQMRLLFLSFVILTCLPGMAQDKPAYQLFTENGKPVSFGKMMKQISEADVVFFGEIHNNSLCHWLELQVTQDLFKQHPEMVMGMEMFEADDQLVLNEYVNGIIQEKHLMSEAKVWNNYETDYRPLVVFAKNHDMKVVATNIPRRYANLVYREGLEALDTLSEAALQWIVPLPVEVDLTLPGYQKMTEMMGGHNNGNNAENLAKSQAIKDATMAHLILENAGGKPFLHFNGTYHSQNREGILWYLQQARPDLKIATIHTVEQKSIDALEEEYKNTADFVLCIPDDMTKTY